MSKKLSVIKKRYSGEFISSCLNEFFEDSLKVSFAWLAEKPPIRLE